MIDTLPDNVQLIENAELISWKKNNETIECKFKNNIIKTKKIIFCTNGFLRSLKVKKNYSFPITLTASMTRPLSDEEFEEIGSPKEWGVLPIRPMGATIRMTKDRRILIRNTAELRNPFSMDKYKLNQRSKIHLQGIKKRFQIYQMILLKIVGQVLFAEVVIVHRYSKKLIKIYMRLDVIMDLELVLVHYLVNK